MREIIMTHPYAKTREKKKRGQIHNNCFFSDMSVNMQDGESLDNDKGDACATQVRCLSSFLFPMSHSHAHSPSHTRHDDVATQALHDDDLGLHDNENAPAWGLCLDNDACTRRVSYTTPARVARRYIPPILFSYFLTFSTF